jgi:hypothetical protein
LELTAIISSAPAATRFAAITSLPMTIAMLVATAVTAASAAITTVSCVAVSEQ